MEKIYAWLHVLQMFHLHYIFECTAVIIISILLCEVLRLREEMSIRKLPCMKKGLSVNTKDNIEIRQSLNQSQLLEYLQRLHAQGSSVWCWGSKHTDRICHFHNLCYVSDVKSFVFFHGINSTMVGVPKDRFEPALLDLSSVENHNAKYFNFMDVPVWAAGEMLTNVDLFDGPSLLFSRFHPNNIMHVIHDDILPLYTTLKMIQSSAHDLVDVQVLFVDEHDVDNEYLELYGLFTTHLPMQLSKGADHDLSLGKSHCFSDVYVGLSKHSIWYQYGFYKPQGPVPDATVTSQDIHQFTSFVLSKLEIAKDGENGLIVLATRKETRLIINEMELILTLSKHLQRRVVSVSLETHSVHQIIEAFSHATMVIGMHGSLLVFSLFLPPGGILIELFPYGINPDHYTPYKTFANMRGMDIIYRSWQNQDKSKSVQHPDRPKELGGILHLSEEEQNMIWNSNEVKPHLCCSDPNWLFHIYQDTVVNIDKILDLVDSSLKEQEEILRRTTSKQGKEPKMDSEYVKHPAQVDAVCSLSCGNNESATGENCLPSLCCHWKSPWNSKYIGDVTYKIWIQEVQDEQYETYSILTTKFCTGRKSDIDATYNVWIRAYLSGLPGPVMFTSCNKKSND